MTPQGGSVDNDTRVSAIAAVGGRMIATKRSGGRWERALIAPISCQAVVSSTAMMIV